MSGISRSWIVILLLSVAMAEVALFYQYVLGIQPCVSCIHARLWTLGLIVVSVIGVILSRFAWTQPILAIIAAGFSLGLGETAYSLLSIEQGWSIGSCAFDAGLPSWFALDEWLPAVFMPFEPCSATPELLFGITMAEGLLFTATAVGLLSLVKLLSAIATLLFEARIARNQAQ